MSDDEIYSDETDQDTDSEFEGFDSADDTSNDVELLQGADTQIRLLADSIIERRKNLARSRGRELDARRRLEELQEQRLLRQELDDWGDGFRV